MKNLLTLLLIISVCVLPHPCDGQTQPSATAAATEASETEAVRKIEEAWYEALKARDRAAMESLLSEGFISQGRTKEVINREKFLTSLAREGDESWVAKVKDVRVRVYTEDAALATGRITFSSTAPGQAKAASFNYTHMYAKRGGAWKIVSENHDPAGGAK